MTGMAVLLAVLAVGSPPASALCPVSEWVDLDTPSEVCDGGKTDFSGTPLQLVFSDEFNVDGRTFEDGHDPKWTAVTGYPVSNEQVNAYVDMPEYAHTANGKLRLKAASVTSNMQYVNSTNYSTIDLKRAYASPMLQSWNKFCFTEGVIEMSGHLPGEANQGGLWPAFWIMGNIGRATAQKSTDKIWPFSYSHCPDEADEAANQYIKDQQLINACRGPDWTSQYGLNPYQGRGAIEIDIVEAMPGKFVFDYKNWKIDSGYCGDLTEAEYSLLVSPRPMVATSLQLAPGIPFKADQRPLEVDIKFGGKQKYNCVPSNWSTQWYPELKQGNFTTYGKTYQSQPNVDFWGEYFKSADNGIDLQTDSMSSLNTLPGEAWTGQHVYVLDWKSGSDGWVSFTMDGKKQFHVNSSSAEREQEITRNGESIGTLLGRQMPEEPSYMMLNIDLARRWGWPDCQHEYCNCCADCRDPKCTTCYYPWQPEVNSRQWLADLCTTLPGYYEIDSVRIWQRPNNTRTSCSPTDYPTQGWIDSHRENFVLPNMNDMLRPVYAGGSDCIEDVDCGGPGRGVCTDGSCNCQDGWTGPKCLAQKAGSSLICKALEDAVVGGAACDTESTSSCNALRGRGECLLVVRPHYAENQTILMPDNKTWKMVGGGMGRCQCREGWGGPACTEPRSTDQCTPEDFPSPSWLGADLEAYIERVCAQSQRWSADSVTSQACSQVLWKPHWEVGGNYSVCGSWPRALWVARTLGCEKKQSAEVDLVLVGVSVGISGFILIAGCVVLACRKNKPMYGGGGPGSKPVTKAGDPVTKAADPVAKAADVEDVEEGCGAKPVTNAVDPVTKAAGPVAAEKEADFEDVEEGCFQV